jgi:hypothetical protein
MHPAILRICAAFVIFPFAVILHRSHIPAQNSSVNDNPTESRVWLAVEEHSRGELLIEPIATVEDSVLTPVQTSCLSDTVTAEDFSSKYLESGRKYALLFGGASVGEGQVGEPNRGAATASLTYAGSLKIRGQVRALATNRDSGDFRAASREPATAEQRGAALALARQIFSQHGIREALLPKVRTEYVTRTYLAPSPEPSLIASFSTASFLSPASLVKSFSRSFSGFIFPRAKTTRSISVLWIMPTSSEMDRMKSLLSSSLLKLRLIVTWFFAERRTAPTGNKFSEPSRWAVCRERARKINLRRSIFSRNFLYTPLSLGEALR